MPEVTQITGGVVEPGVEEMALAGIQRVGLAYEWNATRQVRGRASRVAG